MAVQGKEVKIIKPTKGKDGDDLLRVGAYCRVSTDSEDQLNSFFTQVQHYNDYIRENEKMRLVDIYADEGITGVSIARRDEFKRMMRDAKNRKLDRILVKSVTRFARNALECIEAVRELKACGVSVYFENDNIDTGSMNSEMILYIKSAFSQGEAMSASKRMQTSVRMKMEDGTYVNSSVPFGYRFVDDTLVVEPKEAEIVREIYQMYLSGKGATIILKYMQAKMPEMKWSENGINYILSNERYIGDSLWQKKFTPHTLPLRLQKNTGELPKYYCENTHEAIITKEVFEAVRGLMKKRSKCYKSPTGEKAFFSGRLRCKKCGWVYKRREKKNGTLYWTCSRKGRDSEVCHAPELLDSEIRTAFIRMFNILKQNEHILIAETIAQLQALKTKINSGNNAIAEIDEELMALSKKNAAYSELLLQGVIDYTLFVQQTDALNQKIYDLRTRRIKLINEDEDEKCIEQLRELQRTVNAAECLTEMDETLFEKIADTVLIEQNGTMVFRLKCGLEFPVERW